MFIDRGRAIQSSEIKNLTRMLVSLVIFNSVVITWSFLRDIIQKEYSVFITAVFYLYNKSCIKNQSLFLFFFFLLHLSYKYKQSTFYTLKLIHKVLPLGQHAQ